MKKDIVVLLLFGACLVAGMMIPASAYQVYIQMGIGLGILIMGGEFLVRGASAIALRLNISPMIIGLTVVALGTSAPELFISVQSALKGHPDMAMGNVVGSNICNLTLVLGAMLMLASVPVNQDSIKTDWPVMMAASLLLFFVTADFKLVRYEGIIFVILIVSYIIFLIRKSQKNKKSGVVTPVVAEGEKTKPLALNIVLIVAGGFGLYYGSEWFVLGAQMIFIDIVGMDPRLVGIIVLAIGTSLPELVASMIAAYKKSTQMALGGLIGSNIFNILSILGITSIIKEISMENGEAMRNFDMIWMMGIAFLLLPLMIFRNKLSFVSGLILLTLYFTYVSILLYYEFVPQ